MHWAWFLYTLWCATHFHARHYPTFCRLCRAFHHLRAFPTSRYPPHPTPRLTLVAFVLAVDGTFCARTLPATIQHYPFAVYHATRLFVVNNAYSTHTQRPLPTVCVVIPSCLAHTAAGYAFRATARYCSFTIIYPTAGWTTHAFTLPLFSAYRHTLFSFEHAGRRFSMTVPTFQPPRLPTPAAHARYSYYAAPANPTFSLTHRVAGYVCATWPNCISMISCPFVLRAMCRCERRGDVA